MTDVEVSDRFRVKYAVERVFCLLAFVFLFPFMVLLALAVKLTSSGPIFYLDRRLGLNGRFCDHLKFRSLKPNVPEIITADRKVVVEEGDVRLTPIGRYLRIGFDELPQLVNVIRGEMTLIGVRADPPWMLGQYLPYQRARLTILPGLTSLAVVCDSRRITVEEAYAIDYWYMTNRSPMLDARIAVMTVLYMLGWKRVGAGIRKRILSQCAGLYEGRVRQGEVFAPDSRSALESSGCERGSDR
jgi:undecaprenyl phosphate N,N'-diacetylbacillosamine 1-phosphate transferase